VQKTKGVFVERRRWRAALAEGMGIPSRERQPSMSRTKASCFDSVVASVMVPQGADYFIDCSPRRPNVAHRIA